MDIITEISPYEYIGNSLGKINQNFVNLQRLPVTLSAKYIQMDNFITSLRSQIVTDSAQISGDASVKETFRAEGNVVLGSNTRAGENVLVYSYPYYLANATASTQSLIFGGSPDNSVLTNLYRSAAVSNYANTLQTDGDFRVSKNLTTVGNLYLSGAAQIATLATGSTNDVITHDTNVIKTRSINDRVWGTSLLDGSSLTQNKITKVSDSNTLVNSNISDDGTTITLDGRLTVKNNIVAGTAILASGTVTVTTAAAGTGSIILVTLKTRSGTTTTTWQYAAVPTTGSFTITALTNANATNTTDTSTLFWMLVNVA